MTVGEARAPPAGAGARLTTTWPTIVLHWGAFAVLVTSLLTGLRIAADAPGSALRGTIGWMLPQGQIWTVHFTSGLLLAALIACYFVYLRRSGRQRQVALSRATFRALLKPGRGRWRSINNLLFWWLFLALPATAFLGMGVYAGWFGQAAISIHRWIAWTLVGYMVLHVTAQGVFGGPKQLLRIFRPTSSPRQEAAAPFLRRPATLATEVAAVVLALLLAADGASRDELLVRYVQDLPVIDGDPVDAAWVRAPAVEVLTTQGANVGQSLVRIRAMHDGESISFLFEWQDATRSLKHLPLIKREAGWFLLHEQYDIEDEDSYYEDKFAVMLSADAGYAGGNSMRLGPRPLAHAPAPLSGRGLHVTSDGSVRDIWHWKAVRGADHWVDDNHFGAAKEPKPSEMAGTVRYKAGYSPDPGKASFASNFDAEGPGGYRQPLQPKFLPASLTELAAIMGPVDLDPASGEGRGARWFMLDSETVPYTGETDRAVPVGTVIPGIVVSGDYAGDRADVEARASWDAGWWRLETRRRLDTGSEFDVSVKSGVALRVAVFDRSQTRHTRHARPVVIRVEPASGGQPAGAVSLTGK